MSAEKMETTASESNGAGPVNEGGKDNALRYIFHTITFETVK